MDQNAIISKIKSQSVAKLRISAIAIVFTYREALVSRINVKNLFADALCTFGLCVFYRITGMTNHDTTTSATTG